MPPSRFRPSNIRQRLAVRVDPFYVFVTPEARSLNAARLDHLASLGLPIDRRKVLEVGAGIGLLTDFFLGRGCSVLSTDSRKENVAEMRRRHPDRNVAQLDLEHSDEILAAGAFDIVFCYGTLYHLSDPEQTLRALAEVSSLILLETCCTPGDTEDVNIVSEQLTVRNQSNSGRGCRPTRPWVLRQVRDCWGHGYLPLTQPDHGEFPLAWSDLQHEVRPTENTRAILVGSRSALDNPLLTEDIPETQSRYRPDPAAN
jgi:hypothetical protein